MNEELKKLLDSVKTNATGDSKNEEFLAALTGIVPAKEAELNLDLVKKFTEENDAGKEFLTNYASNASKSAIDTFKSSDDFKGLTQKASDEAVAKALDAFKKEHKLDPETPAEATARIEREKTAAKIKEMSIAQEDLQKRLLNKEIETFAVQQLSAVKLGADLLPFVAATDVVGTEEKIKTLKAVIDKEVADQVKDQISKLGSVPKEFVGGNTKITQQMIDDLAKKAKESGALKDRVAYSEAKQIFALNNK